MTLTKICAVIIGIGSGIATPVWAEWPADSIAIGVRDNPKILARFGGPIENGDLAEYVSNIGADIVSQSGKPDEIWVFSVLDSPEVNAFALPGGFVYVTRGLLALANSEAELAAVLAHEITHVIDQHVEQREAANKDAMVNGALGALAQGLLGGDMGDAIRDNIQAAIGEIGAYSQEQEYAADLGGIQLLKRSGYDTYAQADFLASMAANSALRGAMAGRGYDAEKVPFFATHPAPVDREIIARELAAGGEGVQNRREYLAAINGLRFGDNHENGAVRGQVYTHPVLGFTFTAADGLTIQNRAQQINIIGPRSSTLIMTGARDKGGSLTRYISGWADSLPRRDRIGRRMRNLQNITINGLEAATGSIGFRRNARRGDMQLTVIRFDGQLIRFAGFSLDRDDAARNAAMETVQSFANLDFDSRLALKNYQVQVHTVTGRDTIAILAEGFPNPEFAEAQFRALNAMGNTARLTRGGQVKIIVELP